MGRKRVEKQIKATEDKSDAVRTQVRLPSEAAHHAANKTLDNSGSVGSPTTRSTATRLGYYVMDYVFQTCCCPGFSLLGV
jgi:hypothetical protein